MKTVLLEITNGPKADQKIWIRLGVSIKLGSGRLADLIINTDPTLAPLHASINHRQAGCFLECIEPDGKVLINGKSMQRSRLRDGDSIVAGKTELKVSVHDDAVNPTSAEPPEQPTEAFESADERESQGIPQVLASKEIAKQSEQPVSKIDHPLDRENVKQTLTNPQQEDASVLPYVAERLAGELWRLEPLSEVEFPLTDAIRLLADRFNCFICIDDHILNQFEGIESEVQNRHDLGNSLSLIQLSLDGTHLVLESAEARQVATIIFTRESFETICQLVVKQSFSFRRPNNFATQMEVATPGVAASTMSHISGVLVADRSRNWKLFTTAPIENSWKEMGFPNQPVEIESRH